MAAVADGRVDSEVETEAEAADVGLAARGLVAVVVAVGSAAGTAVGSTVSAAQQAAGWKDFDLEHKCSAGQGKLDSEEPA